MSLLPPDFVAGQITAWFGSVGNIPAGFALCDGTQGTPDLRDKFVVCAEGVYMPAQTGGAAAHAHAFTSAVHYHSVTEPPPFEGLVGAAYVSELTGEVAAGTTDPKSSLSPYYALCYIMKL